MITLIRLTCKYVLPTAIVATAAVVALTMLTGWIPSVPNIAALVDLRPEVGERESLASVEAATVTVEPISLDCRARVNAVVPISGQREHKALGVTYRTDTVELVAIGDVDTCVDGGTTTVSVADSGATLVRIPAESIRFVRPRVDAVATASSVRVSKGVVGKWTDQYPWVSDDLGLTPQAYALAQTIIGSSECMNTAVDRTKELINEAYKTEAIARGADPDSVTVQIVGAVRLPALAETTADFDTWDLGEVACTLVDGSTVVARGES